MRRFVSCCVLVCALTLSVAAGPSHEPGDECPPNVVCADGGGSSASDDAPDAPTFFDELLLLIFG